MNEFLEQLYCYITFASLTNFEYPGCKMLVSIFGTLPEFCLMEPKPIEELYAVLVTVLLFLFSSIFVISV